MARAKASMTKTALFNAMASAGTNSASSRAVVDRVKADPNGKQAIIADQEEILDLGLMTMAGRIAARPAGPAGQGELFTQGRPKQFTDIRVSEAGASATQRVLSTKITMQQWFSQPTKPGKGISTTNHRTNDDVMSAYFNKMKEEDLPPETTLGDYLGI